MIKWKLQSGILSWQYRKYLFRLSQHNNYKNDKMHCTCKFSAQIYFDTHGILLCILCLRIIVNMRWWRSDDTDVKSAELGARERERFDTNAMIINYYIRKQTSIRVPFINAYHFNLKLYIRYSVQMAYVKIEISM